MDFRIKTDLYRVSSVILSNTDFRDYKDCREREYLENDRFPFLALVANTSSMLQIRHLCHIELAINMFVTGHYRTLWMLNHFML